MLDEFVLGLTAKGNHLGFGFEGLPDVNFFARETAGRFSTELSSAALGGKVIFLRDCEFSHIAGLSSHVRQGELDEEAYWHQSLREQPDPHEATRG